MLRSFMLWNRVGAVSSGTTLLKRNTYARPSTSSYSMMAGVTSSSSLNRFRYQRSFSTAMKPAEEEQIINVEIPKRKPLSLALRPREVVEQLDRFIVGQNDAKRAVAIALRNRWRRHQLDEDLRNEVIPKNILMIGPTGCGKTEIARKIAKLSQAPFLKVEATKYTEVGFHGKDVDQIIRDLVDISINITKKRIKEEIKVQVESAVENRILDALVGPNTDQRTRESMRSTLKSRELEDRKVDIEVPAKAPGDKFGSITFDGNTQGAFMGVPGDLSKLMSSMKTKKTEKKQMYIKDARIALEEAESDKILEDYDIVKEAITSVEESGIVFIDEIDKLVSGGDYRGADASSEGVQRDLLPIIEGSTVSTKHGNVNTEFILFVCSGAFHHAKPSDLLAELQGRLPIRVYVKALTEEDMYKILTEPVSNLIRQQLELMASEDFTLTFTDSAIREIARVSFEVNKTVENIGARRLHTVIERIVEEISFDAPDKPGETLEIDDHYVKSKVSDLLIASDLKKFIL